MKLRGFLLIIVAGLLLAADEKKVDDKKADDQKADAAIKAEKEKLKGAWTAESDELEGRKSPEDVVKKIKLTIADDTSTLTEDQLEKPGKYAIDPTTKPAILDLTPTQGPEKGKIIKAIYALEGDTLKVAIALAGPDRPTEFVAKKGSPVRVMVFKRVKP